MSDAVHCALYEPATRNVVSASIERQRRQSPVARGLSRTRIPLGAGDRDLFGIEFVGLPDPRPWIDHGRWPLHTPLAELQRPRAPLPPYRFLEAQGPSLHQIPVGPVHAGIIEPGHFRFTASGETVVRLEERLGYTHKGIEKLLDGKSIDDAARVAARVSGDSTVAYSFVLRSRRGGGTRVSAAAARGVATCGDGGARAHRESLGRRRRDLQRRGILDDARGVRHPARSGITRVCRRVRPSSDDGPHCPGRRRRGSRAGRPGGDPRA